MMAIDDMNDVTGREHTNLMKHASTLLLMLLLVAYSAAGQDLSPPVLREAVFQLPSTLDPHVALVPDWNRFWMQAYEAPLKCELESGKLTVKPLLLATMPTISSGGLVYTLAFRDNISFHDDPCFEGGKGRLLKASDFASVLRRHIDPSFASPFYSAYLAGRLKGADAARAKAEADGLMDETLPIAGITVLSDTQIRLTFEAPFPQFTALMSMPWLSLIPNEARARYGSAISERMVGTGPYLLDRAKTNGRELVFAPNPNYWGIRSAQPRNGGVRFSLVAELPHHEQRFASGEIQLLDLWAVNRSKFLTGLGQVRRKVRPRRTTCIKSINAQLQYVSFNMRDKFLGNRKVRQALALAFDRKAYNREFYRGTAILANHMVPPILSIVSGSEEKVWKYGSVDIRRARELLREAGFEDGKGLPEFLLDINYTGEEADRQAAFFAKQWARIGVRLQTRTQDFATFVGRVRDGVTQIVLSGWFADYPDPENFYLMLASGAAPTPGVAVDSPNVGFFSNARYDRLYGELCRLPFGEKRSDIGRQLISIAQEECPWIFLVHPVRETLVSRGVTGFSCRSNYAASLSGVSVPAK